MKNFHRAPIRRARPLLGTLVDIAAVAEENAVRAAFAAVEEVQRLMSYHDPLSEVSRLNREAHRASVEVSAWTGEVLALAQRLASESDGAFDITVAPQLAAMGYLPRTPANRRGERLASWRDLALLPGNRVFFKRPLHLDLGGIAKGFAVDRAVDALLAAGAESGCVNAGGDLRVFGDAPQTIHLRHPAHPGAMARSLALRGAAVATSSDYFSRKRWRGDTVCALIDGRTRHPADVRRSASVIAPTAALADALTKIVLFAPPPVSNELLARHKAACVLLDEAGGILRAA